MIKKLAIVSLFYISLSFSVAPPNAPNNLSPVSVATPTDPQPLFSWSALTDADKYQIVIDTLTANKIEDTITYTASSTSEIITYQPFPKLPEGALAYWKVAGLDASNNIGPYSEQDTFTVSSTPIVTIASVSQRTDGSKNLEIIYSFTDGENDSATVAVTVSPDSGASWYAVFNPDSGSFGKNIQPNSARTILVSAFDSLIGKSGNNLLSIITAEDKNPPASMVYIAPGQFVDNLSYYASVDKGFFIDIAEVNQDDFSTTMSYNPSNFTGLKLPVENLTWYQAILFCNARSKLKGLDTVYTYTSIDSSSATSLVCDWGKVGYRLPTEDEWELACRTGSTSDYFWGNDSASASTYSWYNDNASTQTHQVGCKNPNGRYLHDITGNVMEFCWDIFGTTDRVNMRLNYAGEPTGANRVVRGGAWDSNVLSLKSNARTSFAPDNVATNTGFRCVLPIQ